MLDLAAVRTALGDWLDQHRPDTVERVYRRAVDGAFQAPAVVIGQPTVEEWMAQPCGISRWSWPVHVVTDRPGGDEEATQTQLETSWTQVAGVLEQLLDANPYLGGAQQAWLTRADFGSLLVQGQSYPAYEITIELLG